MAQTLGWTPADLRAASLAEMWLCFAGWARANGALNRPQPMTRARLRDLMEAYPDG